MSPSILLSIALLSTPAPIPRGSPPGVAAADGEAWAVVHGGQLWVCWSEDPGCWRRVELEPAPSSGPDTSLDADATEPAFIDDDARDVASDSDPDRWRLGFWGRRSLWIEIDEQRFRVDVGHDLARRVDELAPTRLTRPRVASCGPRGRRPVIDAGRLAWQDAPRCEVPAPASCPAAPTRVQPRKPAPLRLRAGVELAVTRSWTASGLASAVSHTRQRAGVEVLFVVELGFDPVRARAHARTRAALLRRAHARRPALPAVAPGPLAHAERRALQAAACGGSR